MSDLEEVYRLLCLQCLRLLFKKFEGETIQMKTKEYDYSVQLLFCDSLQTKVWISSCLAVKELEKKLTRIFCQFYREWYVSLTKEMNLENWH